MGRTARLLAFPDPFNGFTGSWHLAGKFTPAK